MTMYYKCRKKKINRLSKLFRQICFEACVNVLRPNYVKYMFYMYIILGSYKIKKILKFYTYLKNGRNFNDIQISNSMYKF